MRQLCLGLENQFNQTVFSSFTIEPKQACPSLPKYLQSFSPTVAPSDKLARSLSLLKHGEIMKPISLVRFNALAGYCRKPGILQLAEELKWFEHGGERVLATLVRDRTDGDFAGMIFGQDRKGRFRWIDNPNFHKSQRRAEAMLRTEMERLSMASDEAYYQGDEIGPPLDFFKLVKPREKLSEDFLKLAEQEGLSPARGIIEPMMHWYEDVDGNFIEQFQTTGFNARIWELYLFATFVEMEYSLDRIHPMPDFTCTGVLGKFNIEAMTVNPSQHKAGESKPQPSRDTEKEKRDFLREHMPTKFGSTLTSKLAKKYWEKPHVAGKPLLFAIQDFSAPGSMVYTRSALLIYLYGYEFDWTYGINGLLNIIPKKITEHRWDNKIIPSGFFDLPDAENVSAVLFNNSGTIAKFKRMGVLAGFGSRRLVLVRTGFAVDHDPNATRPRPFKFGVNALDYHETWTEGLDVFHNPRAKHPIEPEMLPGAAHHWLLEEGQMKSLTPTFHPLASITSTILVKDE